MKKVIALILTFLLTLTALLACGSDGSPSATSDTSSASPRPSVSDGPASLPNADSDTESAAATGKRRGYGIGSGEQFKHKLGDQLEHEHGKQRRRFLRSRVLAAAGRPERQGL